MFALPFIVVSPNPTRTEEEHGMVKVQLSICRCLVAELESLVSTQCNVARQVLAHWMNRRCSSLAQSSGGHDLFGRW